MTNVYPRNFSHIGISVPNLEEAVKFYTEVMGWYLIMEPTDIEEDDSSLAFSSLKILQLSARQLWTNANTFIIRSHLILYPII